MDEGQPTREAGVPANAADLMFCVRSPQRAAIVRSDLDLNRADCADQIFPDTSR
jgi:hypothetical protein